MSVLTAHRTFLADVLTRQAARRAQIDPTGTFPPQPTVDHPPSPPSESAQPSKANVTNYVAGEETIRNDYTAWYGASGEFGSNHILGAADDEICVEYVFAVYPLVMTPR